MSANLLILHPKDPDANPADSESLIAMLQSLGFIDAPLEFEGNTHYRPGEDFLQLMTFLGCSPVVALGEPGLTGEDFCHVAFEGPVAETQFFGGRNVKPPRCPACGHRYQQWSELISEWEAAKDTVQVSCPECGSVKPITALKWRQCAGFGRYFIKVWGIFEGEAVPSDRLLEALQRHTDTAWSYFYYQMA
jgi:DNA-directed RNA polymerase subunit RPC12/RpoP